MKLIFMGPDCGGKSTLAKLAAAHYGIEINANRKKDPAGVVELVAGDVADILTEKTDTFIRDQWPFPVDIIYERTALKSVSPLARSKGYWRNLYAALGVIFVYVTARPSELMKRFAVRGDELWGIEQILDVAMDYEQAYHTGEFAHYCIRVDTSDTTPEAAKNRLILAVAEVQARIIKEGEKL